MDKVVNLTKRRLFGRACGIIYLMNLLIVLLGGLISTNLLASNEDLRNLDGHGRLSPLSRMEKSQIIERLHESNLKTNLAFVASRTSEEVKQLENDLERIKKSKNNLTMINHDLSGYNNKPIVLVIQSLYITDKGLEYYRPFTILRQKEITFYFHRIEKYSKGLEKNKRSVSESLKELLTKYPDRKIVIFGYCAGGVPGLLALSELNEEESKRVHMVTAATPISGYSAPDFFAYMGAPFAGVFTISIGVGSKKLQTLKLNNCEHHVTVNCDKDFHACVSRTGVFPQEKKNMPCGDENTYYYDNESHHSILATSIERYFENN